jgi:hypothetical protein
MGNFKKEQIIYNFSRIDDEEKGYCLEIGFIDDGQTMIVGFCNF